jgi:hypothetical protein
MRFPWQRQSEPDLADLRDRLKTISQPAWEALREYILRTSTTDRFLNIKNEMGMKGFWYTKGFIRGQREILRFVDAALLAAEKEQSHSGPVIVKTAG